MRNQPRTNAKVDRGALLSGGMAFIVVGALAVALVARAETNDGIAARSEAQQAASTATEALVAEWNQLATAALSIAAATTVDPASGQVLADQLSQSDSTVQVYVFDGFGKTILPVDSDLPQLPDRETTRLQEALAPGSVATLGPLGIGLDARRLLAVAPVPSGPAAGEAAWVGVSVSADSLVARAQFADLERSGYLHKVRVGSTTGGRAVAEATLDPLDDPVMVTRNAVGSVWSTAVSPASGWWSAGHRPAAVSFALIVATLAGLLLFELKRAPQRGLATAHRLRRRLKEAHHLLRIEARKRERAEIHLRRGVESDALTGLPTRDRLIKAVNRALRDKRARPDQSSVALLVVGVDKLSEVADSLGDDAADELVSQVARRLRDSMRPRDFVCRLDSERFAALLFDVSGIDGAIEAASRIAERLDRSVRIRRHEIYTSASIGVTTLVTGMETAEDLVREAESATVEARRIGRGQIVAYDGSLREMAARSLILRSDLRPALARNEFRLAYQPIVSLEPGHAPIGMEVLARWEHPREGNVRPDIFIPIAEEDGFIVRLSRWFSRTAVQRYAQWRADDVLPEGFYLSLNVSGHDLHQPDMCEFYEGLVDEFKLDEGVIRLEVTERILTDDVDLAAKNLEQLRDAGIKLMLDDFGTGYSSLSYLYRFPFHTMKIDRSFVLRIAESERERGMLGAILRLAESLDLSTVAEGIETQDIVRVLQDIGCHSAQGYFFSKPMFEDEATSYLVESAHASGRDPLRTSTLQERLQHRGSGRKVR